MVDSAVVARGGLMKRRSIEKPRPLRCDPERICLDEILRLTEEVSSALMVARSDMRTRQKTQQLKELLRINGLAMERFHKDNLDKLEATLREASYDTEMDVLTRLNVLEIIEMRLEKWNASAVTSTMYKQKLAEAQLDIDMRKIGYVGGLNVVEDILGDEANQSRGDTGCDGDVILKLLNAEKDDLKYKSSLIVNGQKIQISSSSKQIVNTSKEVLIEFYSIIDEDDDVNRLSKPKICYEKDELLRLSRSPLCKEFPVGWDSIIDENPFIARRVEKEGAPAKHFLRELEGIKKQEALRKM